MQKVGYCMKCIFNMKKSELLEEVLRLRSAIQDLHNVSNFEICEELGCSTNQESGFMSSIRLGYLEGKLSALSDSFRSL